MHVEKVEHLQSFVKRTPKKLRAKEHWQIYKVFSKLCIYTWAEQRVYTRYTHTLSLHSLLQPGKSRPHDSNPPRSKHTWLLKGMLVAHWLAYCTLRRNTPTLKKKTNLNKWIHFCYLPTTTSFCLSWFYFFSVFVQLCWTLISYQFK